MAFLVGFWIRLNRKNIEEKRQMTSRSYVFTSFDMDWKYEHNEEKVRFIVFQKEKCPETERLHWQGYVEFFSPVRITGAKKILKVEAHMEKRLGTRVQAVDYCTKEESRVDGPFEWGKSNSGGQGKRNDLRVFCEAILEKKSMRDCVEDDPGTFVRYYKGLYAYKNLVASRDDRPQIVYFRWGEPGSGKTKWVFDTFGYYDVYQPIIGTNKQVWFDNYDGEKVLLLDDFRGEIEYSYLLRLLDRYPMLIPIKGGSTYAQWCVVVITSNVPIKDMYVDTTALERRINVTTQVTKCPGNNETGHSDARADALAEKTN